MNAIDGIIKFQKDRQLDKQEYNEKNEITSIIEELVEITGYFVPKENRIKLTDAFLDFHQSLMDNNIAYIDDKHDSETSVDGFCDIIVFSIGAIMKLGYDPKLALKEVSKEINSRKGKIINGKFEKYLPDEPGYEKPYKANFKTCKLPKEK